MHGTCCLNAMHCVVLVIDMQLFRTQSIFAHAEFAWGPASEANCISYLMIKLIFLHVTLQETDAMIAYASSQSKILEGSSNGSDEVCPCCSLCLAFCDLVLLIGSTKSTTLQSLLYQL